MIGYPENNKNFMFQAYKTQKLSYETLIKQKS